MARAALMPDRIGAYRDAHAFPRRVFPEVMTENVYRLGYNATHSYGAHSFLIRRKTGNAMVDAPRWTRAVAAQIEAWGGLAEILLTHRDDIADAERYAKAFGARVWIHQADRAAARFASNILKGREPFEIAPDLIAIPVPGTPRAASFICTISGACSRATRSPGVSKRTISSPGANTAGTRGRS
jgi:hypothetical protein